MCDTEADHNGDNPNGWGWNDAITDHFFYRHEGNIVAQIYKGIIKDVWYGNFMGASQIENKDMAQVFRAILVKLVEFGY